ncbi:hypothetical protein J3Q64DRAFT_1819087 [Phycomyces blakesleeanus]|uniref:Uncharacterized protein n=1 Tax=Phycomyces blakesleeanus TaxID=4837 RepID=A0ABR3BAG8_PHYBL
MTIDLSNPIGNWSIFRHALPPRCHTDPRNEEGQRRQFGWGLCKKLAWDVLGSSPKRLSIEDLGICIDNVRRSHMINYVIDRVNREHHINEHTKWAPHLPLRACVRNWGAKMMLRKFWNNGLPISKQNDNTNNSKSDHVVFDHTADSLQCSPRSQFNTFASQNVPLNPLMGQTVTMMSFPKKTAIHTITFVKTYLDKVELKNQEGFHQTTLFKSV